MTLIYLAQTQNIAQLSPEALASLLKFRSLAGLLADFTQKFDTSNFLRLLLDGILSHWYANSAI